LLPHAQFYLYKRRLHQQTEQSDTFQLFKSIKSETNPITLNWHSDVSLNSLTDNIIESIETSKVIEYTESDATHHLLIPVINDLNSIALVHLVDSTSFELMQDELSSLVKIYENNLNILHDSENDTLTGLFNRRTFDRKLKNLLANQSLKQNKYSNTQMRTLSKAASAWLVIIDIDHFKKVNDKFGHIYGDEVLLRLSQIMQDSFRSTDLLFRFGGEEFVIILEPISTEMAFNTLERFRLTVSEFTFPLVGHVTISLGYSKISETDFPPTVLEQADKALYYSKENGRNSAHLYETLISEEKLIESKLSDEGEIDLF
ncbi:MAG: GGDEF domain-containing protein, partial [Gammaproteobacteria bacterium]|nr:GGDEF domain-containing protein [Gammaproteobacteria bacterium]